MASLERNLCVLPWSNIVQKRSYKIVHERSHVYWNFKVYLLSIPFSFSRPRATKPEKDRAVKKGPNQPIRFRQWVTCKNRTKPCEHPVERKAICVINSHCCFRLTVSNFKTFSFRKRTRGHVLDKIFVQWCKISQWCVVGRESFAAQSLWLRPRVHLNQNDFTGISLHFIYCLMAAVVDVSRSLEEEKLQHSSSMAQLFDSTWFLLRCLFISVLVYSSDLDKFVKAPRCTCVI